MMRHADDIIANVLNECWELLAAGESVSACLERFPQHAAALAPLLGVLTEVRELRAVPPRSEVIAAQRRGAFLAAVRRLHTEPKPLTLSERLARGGPISWLAWQAPALHWSGCWPCWRWSSS